MKKIDMSILKPVVAIFVFMLLMPAAGVWAAEDVVDLNAATVEELTDIEDLELGEAIAKAIVQYRETNGAFKKPEDLLKVPGMTEELFDQISPVMEDGTVVYEVEEEEAAMKAY